MKPIVMILLLLGCTFSAFADKVPSELKGFEVLRVNKIKEIDGAYVKALEKLMVKYTKRGDLNSANAINTELSHYTKPSEKNVTVEHNPDNDPTELKKLRGIRAKKIKEIDDAYLKALEKLKVKYTKLGDLESANAVATALKKAKGITATSLNEDETATDIKKSENSSPAQIYSKAKFTRFRDGADMYTNSSGGFAEVPDKFAGWMISVNRKKETAPLTFKVKEAGVVTLVIGNTGAGNWESKGWSVASRAKISYGGSQLFGITMLEKYLEEGEYSFKRASIFGLRILKQ